MTYSSLEGLLNPDSKFMSAWYTGPRKTTLMSGANPSTNRIVYLNYDNVADFEKGPYLALLCDTAARPDLQVRGEATARPEHFLRSAVSVITASPKVMLDYGLFDMPGGPVVNVGGTDFRGPSGTAAVTLPPATFAGSHSAVDVQICHDMVRVASGEYLTLLMVTTADTVTTETVNTNLIAVRTQLSGNTVTATVTAGGYVTHDSRAVLTLVDSVWTGSGVKWWTADGAGQVFTVEVSMDAQTVTVGAGLGDFGHEYDRLAAGDDVQYAKDYRDGVFGVVHQDAYAHSRQLRDDGNLLPVVTSYASGGVAGSVAVYLSRHSTVTNPNTYYGMRGDYPMGHPSRLAVGDEGFFFVGVSRSAAVFWDETFFRTDTNMWIDLTSPPVIS